MKKKYLLFLLPFAMLPECSQAKKHVAVTHRQAASQKTRLTWFFGFVSMIGIAVAVPIYFFSKKEDASSVQAYRDESNHLDGKSGKKCIASQLESTSEKKMHWFQGKVFKFGYSKELPGKLKKNKYGELVQIKSLEGKEVSFEAFFETLAKGGQASGDFSTFLQKRAAECSDFTQGYFLRFPGLSYQKKQDFKQPCKFLLRQSPSFKKADPNCWFKAYFKKDQALLRLLQEAGVMI